MVGCGQSVLRCCEVGRVFLVSVGLLTFFFSQTANAQKFNTIRCRDTGISLTSSNTSAEDFRRVFQLSDDGNKVLVSSSFLRSQEGALIQSPGFYIWDKRSGSATLVSVLPDGSPVPIANLVDAGMSGDGNTVTFLTSVRETPESADGVRNEFRFFVRDVSGQSTRTLLVLPNRASTNFIAINGLSGDGKIMSWLSFDSDFYETTVVDVGTGASAVIPGGSFRVVASMLRDGTGYSLDGNRVFIPGSNAGAINRTVDPSGVVSFSFTEAQKIDRRPGELLTYPRGKSHYISVTGGRGEARRTVGVRGETGGITRLYTASDSCKALETSVDGTRSILSCLPLRARPSQEKSLRYTIVDTERVEARCYTPKTPRGFRVGTLGEYQLSADGSTALAFSENFNRRTAVISLVEY